MATSHGPPKAIYCPHCDECFSRPDLRRRHILRLHPDVEDVIDPNAKKRTPKSDSLRDTDSEERNTWDDVLCPPGALLGDLPDMAAEKIRTELEYTVPLYFGRMHRTYPFLHEATFNKERTPVVLLLAINSVVKKTDTQDRKIAALLRTYYDRQETWRDGATLHVWLAVVQSTFLLELKALYSGGKVPRLHTQCLKVSSLSILGS